MRSLFSLYRKTANILRLVRDSLRPDQQDFQQAAKVLLDARDDYVRASQAAKDDLGDEVAEHRIAPIAALFYRDYLASFDRIVKHARAIALAQQKPDFRIKQKKLLRAEKRATTPELPAPIDRDDFLHRLHMEDYI